MELEEFNRKIVPMRQELLSMARRQTRDDDLAEDSVQEVMLKLWSMRHELYKYGNTRALAIKMIRNWHIDHWRHSQKECHLKTDKDIATTDNTVELKDEISIIRSIVDTLPPLQAQVFRMKEIEGYENEELIKIIGCSPDSLRQNLSRARKKIKEEFIKIRNK